MSDRLNELQRQRALVQEHLAWLEREIAHESGAPAPVASPAPAAPPRPVSLAPRGRDPVAVEAEADAILQQYRDQSRNVKQDVRKGCFLYFVLAFFVLGVAVAALYFYTTHHH